MEKTKAKLISIDGLDGSGKNTQSELLRDRLRAEGHTAEVVSFPMYGEPSCFAVEMYLSGALGGHPDDTGAYPAATFFAVDRYISMRTVWGRLLETNDYIIFNRYTSANAVHQLSKLPRADWDEFLDWLCDFEFACRARISRCIWSSSRRCPCRLWISAVRRRTFTRPTPPICAPATRQGCMPRRSSALTRSAAARTGKSYRVRRSPMQSIMR